METNDTEPHHRGYFEAKLFNVSKALKAYSGELGRKDDMLHKPITQAYAIRNDNKLSLFMCRRQFLNINNVGGLLMLSFFQMPDVLPLPPKWRRAMGAHLKKQSHSNIYMLHQYSENFSSPEAAPVTSINNFVETKQSLLIHTGFWKAQTVLFTHDLLCYQNAKTKSKNEFSWRQLSHLNIMVDVSKALLFLRDFTFYHRAQSCSQEFSYQQHPFLPRMLLCTSQVESCSQKLR